MWWRVTLIWIAVLLAGAIIFAVAVNRRVDALTTGKIQNSITEIKPDDPPRVAVVFGAGVRGNGEPSAVLYDRVLTAVELYRAGRVRKILLSGDNRFENYNEPQAMKETAAKLGAPESALVLDYAGRSTYDTCYRAREIFAVQKAILVTQEFHLTRAVYLCESLGIDSLGVTADRRNYPAEVLDRWKWRDFFALYAAWYQLNISRPTPILGNKEPIE